MSEAVLALGSVDEQRTLLGPYDSHRKFLADRFGVEVVVREGDLVVRGEKRGVRTAEAALRVVLDRMRAGEELEPEAVREVLGGGSQRAVSKSMDTLGGPGEHGVVEPRTDGQASYLEAVAAHTITFATGPAGTGKTFIAVGAAVDALRRGEQSRVVLARPAVEAGESLGFLPGDAEAKVHPYLRPLIDSLNALLGRARADRYFQNGIVEILPLAFMRGRTFHDAFVILDEAQNTTCGQMLMFLTRLGEGSKAVVTGDTSQVDLDRPADSGLIDAVQRLGGREGIATVALGEADIVRHGIVGDVVRAYQDP